jgi:hypothetical protein
VDAGHRQAVPSQPGEVPAVRPDKDGLEALCRIIKGVPLQGYVLVGWRVMLGTKERPVKIDGHPGVFAGCVRSYGPPEAGSDFDHVVDIDLRCEDDGTWTLDTGRPYRANLLSRAHFGLWSFCHEQLGHYTSGAPCGLCNELASRFDTDALESLLRRFVSMQRAAARPQGAHLRG